MYILANSCNLGSLWCRDSGSANGCRSDGGSFRTWSWRLTRVRAATQPSDGPRQQVLVSQSLCQLPYAGARLGCYFIVLE